MCLAALTGCGESEEDKVASAVEEFYLAAGTGDGETACDHLSRLASPMEGGYERCVRVIESGILYDATMKEQFRNVEAGEVKIEGDTAEVRLGPMDSVDLVKQDDKWLIEAETLDAI